MFSLRSGMIYSAKPSTIPSAEQILHFDPARLVIISQKIVYLMFELPEGNVIMPAGPTTLTTDFGVF